MSAAAPDFSDRFSPMLVKELRQGLRGQYFAGPFVALQAALTLVVLYEMASQHASPAFWVLATVFFAILLPLKGLTSVGLERRSRTLELIQLTRISAWRIAFGKWSAGFSQALLAACAILPYLLLRYYVTGVEATGQLIALASLLLLSAIGYALTVGFSSYLDTLPRLTGAIAFVAVMILSLTTMLVDTHNWRMFTHTQLISVESLIGLGWLAVFALIAVALMMEIGAHHLDAGTANHAGKVRLYTIAALALAFIAGGLGGPLEWIIPATLATFLIGALHAVVGRPVHRTVLALPFVRRGWFGRVLARFAYPGWPSGVRFVSALVPVVFASMFGIALFHLGTDDFPTRMFQGYLLVTVATMGAFIVPVFLTRLFAPDTPYGLVHFLWLQLVAAVLIFALTSGLILGLREAPWPLTFFPSCTLFMTLSGSNPGSNFSLWISTTSLSTFAALVALWHLARPDDLLMLQSERKAQDLLAAREAPSAS